MCGIYGITFNSQSYFTPRRFRAVVKKLFILSSSRGKDASGLALMTDDRINIIKRDMDAGGLMKTADYKKLMGNILNDSKLKGRYIPFPITLIGHSRMVTNGTENIHINNQPIVKNGMVVIHNGIVVNQAKIWREFPAFKRETDTDTEVIPSLLAHYLKEKKSLAYAVRQMYQKIEGVASIAVLFENFDSLLLSTNNGSLYTAISLKDRILFFASEKYMLQTLFKTFQQFSVYNILHMEAGDACLVHIPDFKVQRFRLTESSGVIDEPVPGEKTRKIMDITGIKEEMKNDKRISISSKSSPGHLLEDNSQSINRLKCCTRCLLPETFPFITFDEKGVCSICTNYKKIQYKGVEVLKEMLEPLKRKNGEPDIIIPLSGGRDSTFTLHYVKTEMGMNPVAYTYDWGMVTELARRNISRITARLGVEHILVSANINKKRRFIRQNVNAWLRRPRLGTVPLFMAGDKQFFYYANVLKKQLGVNALLFGMNPLELAGFKVGFAGVNEKKNQERFYHLCLSDKLQLFLYYGKEFLLNPALINSSLLDTLGGFISYYYIHHDYHLFYEYFPWDEELIVNTIIDEYDWETAVDTDVTWRIGDGTAAFYNYIYYTVAGFSENDTFRSNQIRQGIISREKALEKVKKENLPRYESIKWYCDTNGIDFTHAIQVINAMPKLYKV